MCFMACCSEALTHSYFPDHSVTVPGFGIFQADRDIYLQGKKKCGRVELVIEKGSNPAHVTAQEGLSGLSNEPLAVGRCPFHSRRQFVITDVCCLNQHTVCFLHQLMQRSSK